jgi:hypothetical protein
MGCLAAQVVSYFKTEVGGFYLMPAGTRDVWEDFIFKVSGVPGDKEPKIEVCNSEEKVLFAGPASKVAAWCKTYEEV